MATKNWFSATQKTTVNDNDKILVYDGSDSRIVEVSLLKGAANLTEDYVELKSVYGELYRVYIDS